MFNLLISTALIPALLSLAFSGQLAGCQVSVIAYFASIGIQQVRVRTMVSADSIKVQVLCKIKSVFLCLFVWASFSSSLAYLILLLSLQYCLFSGFLGFSCSVNFRLNRFNTLPVVLAGYHRKEVLEHYMVVPLWLVVDFRHLSIEVVED